VNCLLISNLKIFLPFLFKFTFLSCLFFVIWVLVRSLFTFFLVCVTKRSKYILSVVFERCCDKTFRDWCNNFTIVQIFISIYIKLILYLSECFEFIFIRVVYIWYIQICLVVQDMFHSSLPSLCLISLLFQIICFLILPVISVKFILHHTFTISFTNWLFIFNLSTSYSFRLHWNENSPPFDPNSF
jgi:hypothetical protein